MGEGGAWISSLSGVTEHTPTWRLNQANKKWFKLEANRYYQWIFSDDQSLVFVPLRKGHFPFPAWCTVVNCNVTWCCSASVHTCTAQLWMTSTFHHEASVFLLKDLKIKSDGFSSCLLYRCYFMLDALLCYIFNHHLLNIIHNKKNTLFLIESPLIYFRFRPRDSSYTSSWLHRLDYISTDIQHTIL